MGGGGKGQGEGEGEGAALVDITAKQRSQQGLASGLKKIATQKKSVIFSPLSHSLLLNQFSKGPENWCVERRQNRKA